VGKSVVLLVVLLAVLAGPVCARDLDVPSSQATPRGGYFVRFVDPAIADFRDVRPAYWNGGPGKITREMAIPTISSGT
jgi:hypothetical protein